MDQLTVTITNPLRAADWVQWLGTLTVPVADPLLRRAAFPGYPGGADYFRLETAWLTERDLWQRLADGIATKFRLNPATVLTELTSGEVPILADDCEPNFTPQRVVYAYDPRVLL